MILTSDDDRRGYLTWTPPDLRIQVVDVTSGGRVVATLRNSEGSAMPSPLPAAFQFRLGRRIDPPGSDEMPRLVMVDSFGCAVWTGTPGETPTRLSWVPGIGHFRRIVLDATNIAWPGDCVVRCGLSLIRFLTGRISGEHAGGGMNEIEFDSAGGYSVTGERIEAAEFEGRFIEVIAVGEDEHAASANAEALLGLLLLVWGFNAGGSVLIDNALDTSSGELVVRLPIPIGLRFPLDVQAQHFQELDLLLPATTTASKVGAARRVALHWFYRGESTESPSDQVLAYFIAVEAIVTAETEGLSEDPKRKALRKVVLTALKVVLSDVERETVANALAGITLVERFSAFASSRSLPRALTDEFANVAKVRNDIFHGRLPRVSAELALAARALAEKVLQATFGLVDVTSRRPAGPSVRSMQITMIVRAAAKLSEPAVADADET